MRHHPLARRSTFVVALLLAAPAAAHATDPFAASGIADWTKPPPPTEEPAFRAPAAKRLKLRNGMALLVVENRTLPLVAMTLVVPGAGAASDPPGKTGLAAFTADLLDEGAGGLSALAIAEAADRLGASISTGTDSDEGVVSVVTLRKTLDPTIELLAKVLTAPAFDEQEVARVKGDRLTSLKLRPDRPREVAGMVLGAALFGLSSPYGHPGSGLLADVEKLGAADAAGFYRSHWNPSAMTLVVAGDVDAAAVKDRLDAALGAWKGKGPARVPPPRVRPVRSTTRLYLVDRPGAEQSDVRIGLIGPPRTDPRYARIEVLRTVLGDGFTSRLNQRLREQLGYTYGIGASATWRRATGPLVIGSAFVTPRTGESIKEVLAIVDGLAKHDVPAPELEKAKQNIVRALPSRFETNASTAEAFAELALHGLRDDTYARYPAEVKKVTARDVRAMARAVLPAHKLVVSVVGDLATVRKELEDLLGKPVLHRPDGLPAD